MSIKHSTTTADYLEWDTATNLIHKLEKDGETPMVLFVFLKDLQITNKFKVQVKKQNWHKIEHKTLFHLVNL